MKRFISIYKSQKKEGMYLYMDKSKSSSELPESFLELFGPPSLVTHMMVEETKKFSRFDARQLFRELDEKGFYFQLPDPLEEYKLAVVKRNDKLG